MFCFFSKNCVPPSANNSARIPNTLPPPPPPPHTGIHIGEPAAHLITPLHPAGQAYLHGQGATVITERGAFFVVNPYTLDLAGPLSFDGVTNAATDGSARVVWARAGTEHSDGTYYVYFSLADNSSTVHVASINPRNLSATLLGSFGLPFAPQVATLCVDADHWAAVSEEGRVFVAASPAAPFSDSQLAGLKRGDCPSLFDWTACFSDCLSVSSHVVASAKAALARNGLDASALLQAGHCPTLSFSDKNTLHASVVVRTEEAQEAHANKSSVQKSVFVFSYDLKFRTTVGEGVEVEVADLSVDTQPRYATCEGHHFVAYGDKLYAAGTTTGASTLAGAIALRQTSHADDAASSQPFVSIRFDPKDLKASIRDSRKWAEAAKKQVTVTAVPSTEKGLLAAGTLESLVGGMDDESLSKLTSSLADKKWYKAIERLLELAEAGSLCLQARLCTGLLAALASAPQQQQPLFFAACRAVQGEVPAEVYPKCVRSVLREAKSDANREALKRVDALFTAGLRPHILDVALEFYAELADDVKARLLNYLYLRLVARWSRTDQEKLSAAGVPTSETLVFFANALLDGSGEDVAAQPTYHPTVLKLHELCRKASTSMKGVNALSGQLTALVGTHEAPALDAKEYPLRALRPIKPVQPLYTRTVVL